ncbi:MAG: family 43 glycosylhydrolase, partial [Polyangiales bacterium]
MRRLTLLSLALLVGCGGSEANDSSSAPDDSASVDDTGALSDSADSIDSDDGALGDTGADDAASTDVGSKDTGIKDSGPPAPTTALLRPDNPMPCADPAVVSENDAGKVFYVYCTSMSHVWKTTDWISFSDVRSSVTFNLGGLSANGKEIGSWWAPGLVYSPALEKYVMWVSVPDAQGTKGTDGWDTRSLAVLTAGSPDGPWTYEALAIDAKPGEHFIDPFLFIDSDGLRFAYWKQYGGAVSSSIMGARIDATWTNLVAGTSMEVMNGFGGTGTWEDNVRENPAVVRDSGGRYHMIFSGGHWFNDTYATGHALSSCGPLCPASSAGGW